MKALLKKTGMYEPVRTLWLSLKRPKWWKRRQAELWFFRHLIPKGARCFDVGANVGTYTADLLEAGAGSVVAVEPQAQCVAELQRKFADDPRVSLVPAAVGPAAGRVTMYASDATAITSCSKEWVDAVRSSGRFAEHNWTPSIDVPTTTLDELIARHGPPAFCKIDVEGFELDVLRGLNTPIPVMSFEFSPETLERTCDCVNHLSRLGAGGRRFNYCSHGHFNFGLPHAVPAEAFLRVLRDLPADAKKWGGDVYAWSRAA